MVTETNAFEVIDVGKRSYGEVLQMQEELFQGMLQRKREGATQLRGTLLLVEHTPVYTLGKSGDLANLKRTPEQVGADFYRITRGGDITYHGPGQIVGYPIFDLELFEMGIAKYIWSLEEAIRIVLNKYGISSGRIEEASGVWIDGDNEKARKICAIGVKASRYVTMHGFAFNVNTDLSYFDHIVPCGIDDKGVTSLSQELGKDQDFDHVKQEVVHAFNSLFVPLI